MQGLALYQNRRKGCTTGPVGCDKLMAGCEITNLTNWSLHRRWSDDRNYLRSVLDVMFNDRKANKKIGALFYFCIALTKPRNGCGHYSRSIRDLPIFKEWFQHDNDATTSNGGIAQRFG